MTRKPAYLDTLKHKLALTAALALVGVACLGAEDPKNLDPALAPKIHPHVFSMIRGWDSDPESPVVTEINLDAVDRNRNQFAKDEVAQEHGWTVVREADGKAFKRYRVIEGKDHRFKVEYQENGGGTLTTSTIIEFSVATRVIQGNGKPTTTRVIRVDSCTTK